MRGTCEDYSQVESGGRDEAFRRKTRALPALVGKRRKAKHGKGDVTVSPDHAAVGTVELYVGCCSTWVGAEVGLGGVEVTCSPVPSGRRPVSPGTLFASLRASLARASKECSPYKRGGDDAGNLFEAISNDSVLTNCLEPW